MIMMLWDLRMLIGWKMKRKKQKNGIKSICLYFSGEVGK